MPKLNEGDVRIAHTRSGASGQDEVVVAEFDEEGVLVTWPRPLGMSDALVMNEDLRVPEPLIARDGEGWVTFCEGHPLGVSGSTLGHSKERIRYWRAIKTGSRGLNYAEVNGMTSEIDGLAKWAKLTPVTQKVLFDAKSRLRGVSLTAENLDSLVLGGVFNLRLTTSYVHSPSPSGGRYAIDTSLLVRTSSSELVSWGEHRNAHQMIQDLMSLVYGKPCLADLKSVMREDDQEREPTDERRFWREAYEPSFGRSSHQASPLDQKAQPLFYLDEADLLRIDAWISEAEYWGRPTWIGVTALFHKDLPAEARLVQVAVALEALGYAIAKYSNPEKEPPYKFEAKLKLIFEALRFLPNAVTGETDGYEGWVASFNAAYNGVKHADNSLTEPVVAWELAEQGITLFRCWLAVHLGVDVDLIQKRLR